MTKQEEILNLLVNETLIVPEQVEDIKSAARFTDKPITEVLLERKVIDEEELAKVKAKVYNLPYANLTELKIDDMVLGTIPEEAAMNYRVVCFGKEDKNIKVGVIDPDDFKAVEAVDFLAKGAGLKVEYYVVSEQSLNAVFKYYKTFKKEISSALKTRADSEAEDKKKDKKVDGDTKIEEVTKSAPVAKIISVIIRHAVEGRASDIHIEPMAKESRVRYRIDGVLHTSLILPRNVHDSLVARVKVMAKLKLDETRIPQDGRIRLTINEKDYDFRVSTLPLLGAEKVVMRILDVSKKAPTLVDLGFQGAGLAVIERNMKKTEGLLLVTGPTGSGKSTTLFSLITSINKEGINISTLEDPVEYQIKGVNQSQVKPEIGYTFATGLRHFLRQDPDVIMVGEIRDLETAELAIHSALTGHYVMSTLHTIDAAGAITRLFDMKIEPFLLGSTLHTVIGQRLARKICKHCKTEANPPSDFIKEIKEALKEIPTDYIKTLLPDYDPDHIKFYNGQGCPRCGNSGYTGRVAISEVLDVNDKLQDMIIDGHHILKLEDIRSTQDFLTFKQDGYLKIIQGITTMEEVLRVIST